MKKKYFCPYTIRYYSKRYNKRITVEEGYPSDGATGASDIWTEGWWLHDKLKDTKKWDDGSECTNIQASFVLYDKLNAEGRWFRKYTWFFFTLAWGELTKILNR